MVPKTKEYAKKLSAVMNTYLNFACYLKSVTKSSNFHTTNVGMIKRFLSTQYREKLVHACNFSGSGYFIGVFKGVIKTLSGALHPNILPKLGKRNTLLVHLSLNHCSGSISIIE